jgi:hypothetical protein
VQVRKVPEPLVEVEAVPDEELVGNGEADVAHRKVVDEPPVGPVEEGRRRERRRPSQRERPAEVVERQAGVDDVLDDQDVSALDLAVEVLEQADPRVAAGSRPGVAGELDEVEAMVDRQGAREVGDEDEARFERGDEQRLAPLVVMRELAAQLGDARRDLPGAEVGLADGGVVG